jgi:tetratricopeptide (TPR) repeat protein
MQRMFQRLNLRKSQHLRSDSNSLMVRKESPRNNDPTRTTAPSKKILRPRQPYNVKCDTSETEGSVTIQQVDSLLTDPEMTYDISVSTSRDGCEEFDGDHPCTEERNHEATTLDLREPRVVVISAQQDDPMILMALRASQRTLEPKLSHYLDIPSSNVRNTATGANHDGRKLISLLDQSGNDLYERGEIDQAFEKYEEALKLKRQALLDQYDTAHQAEYVSEEDRARKLASIATSINNLAFLRQIKGLASSQETLESYEMALQIKREILGPDHLSVGKTLNNIGSIYFLQQNYKEAALTYEQARDILQLHLGCEHLDVCTVAANLGDVYCGLHEYALAVKEYRIALDLRWKLLGPTDARVIRLMEQIAELEMFIDRENVGKDRTVSSKRHERFYGPIVKDVRKLQKELQRDLEDLNFLESQLPIEMSKDKAVVFRELLEMKSGNYMENDETATDSDVILNSECKTVDINFSPISRDFPRFAEKNDECVLVNSTDPTQLPLVSPSPPNSPSREFAFTTSPLRLTPDERKQALSSIKEKLANMKAKRGLFPPPAFGTEPPVSSANTFMAFIA